MEVRGNLGQGGLARGALTLSTRYLRSTASLRQTVRIRRKYSGTEYNGWYEEEKASISNSQELQRWTQHNHPTKSTMQDDCHEGLGREGASFGRAEYLGPVGGTPHSGLFAGSVASYPPDPFDCGSVTSAQHECIYPRFPLRVRTASSLPLDDYLDHLLLEIPLFLLDTYAGRSST
jgi:hypothetical protein